MSKRTPDNSTRLGLALRSILLRPEVGFASTMGIAHERSRDGRSPAEGWSPSVLAFLGGAALMSTWLKVGGLIGRREVATADFSWINLSVALFAGGLLALVAMFLWGRIGPPTFKGLRADASRLDLRIVWGAAWLPQVLGLIFLLPLDLLIVGPRAFTTDRLSDSLSTAWAALSLAVAVALVIWSLHLFVKGTEVAADVPVVRSTMGLAVGGVCLGALVAGFIAAAAALSRTLT